MKVYGVYKEKRVSEKQTQYYTLLMMLEFWWKDCLYRPGINGVEQLIKILEDSNLKYLVQEMTEHDDHNNPEYFVHTYRCISNNLNTFKESSVSKVLVYLKESKKRTSKSKLVITQALQWGP